ncbi:hypothetical protein BHE74_00012034 [Ensete ventricosum]|uniref:Syntaxin N-terminal domain-containing protein n=1 Tax=Ensete ventricosum TaxID=4639 RepID=A0A445MAH7_ENSVE|nr:hypothetical protein BHE74_00012034 [Ensete ventricosum]RZR71250.1 hypothetical protein BHM03_00004236 [Ensete ventricosum]
MSFQDLESGRPLTGRRDLANGRQDSTQAVAAGLFQITTAVRNFEYLVNTIGTPKDTPELRQKCNARLHIGQLVKDTCAKLEQASETDHRVEVSVSVHLLHVLLVLEQGIQEIQQQIDQVNEIFKDLAVLVHDQGVVIGKKFGDNCVSFFNVLAFGNFWDHPPHCDHSRRSIII